MKGTVGAEALVRQRCTKRNIYRSTQGCIMEKAVDLHVTIGVSCVLQTVDKFC